MEESASDGASESAANDAVPCPYAADPMANSIVGIANALRMLHPWFQRGNDLWTVLPDEARVHARSFRGRRGPLVAFRKALAPASCARVARARLSTIVKGSARQFIRTIGPTLRAPRWGRKVPRISTVVDHLRQDFSYALRSLRRSPGFAVTVIATLALGVGANTALFSLADRLFLQEPAGVVDPGSLRSFYERTDHTSGSVLSSGGRCGYPQYSAVRQGI